MGLTGQHRGLTPLWSGRLSAPLMSNVRLLSKPVRVALRATVNDRSVAVHGLELSNGALLHAFSREMQSSQRSSPFCWLFQARPRGWESIDTFLSREHGTFVTSEAMQHPTAVRFAEDCSFDRMPSRN